jgi:hypothetical protein
MLDVFRACENTPRTQEDLRETLGIRDDDLKKTLYEMLRDRTLVYNADEKLYEAASFDLRGQRVALRGPSSEPVAETPQAPPPPRPERQSV